MIKLVRCPEVVTLEGDQCVKILDHVGLHEIDLSKRPRILADDPACLWCGQHVQVNSTTGACLACGEIAQRAAEASTFLGWFVKGGLIVIVAMTVGAIIATFR